MIFVLSRIAIERRLARPRSSSAYAVTALSVMRRPGIAFSSTFVFDESGAPPSIEYTASRALRSGVWYAASSASTPPLETVKSEVEPVMREDSTSRSSPRSFLTMAATTGPAILALIASAICWIVASAATLTVIDFGSPAA